MSARYPVMHYTSQKDSLKFCLLRTNPICLKVRRCDICVFKLFDFQSQSARWHGFLSIDVNDLS